MLIQKILLTTGFLGIIAGTTLCVVFVAVGDIYYLIRGFAHLLFGLILMPILKVPGTVKIVAFGSSIILLFLDF